MEEKQENNSIAQEMTAGEMLRNARTTGRRKREISTISKMLCIKEEFLAALEDGNYRVIPEDVYILGFARSYAVELGLNPDEIIAKLKRELGLMAAEEKEEEKEEIKDEEETIKTKEEDIPNTVHKSFLKKYWMWFVGGLMALVLIVISAVMVINNTKDENISDTNSVEMVNADTSKEIAFKARVAATYPESKRFDINESRVAFQAVDRECWIQVKDKNADIVFSRVLLPGDVFYVNPNGNYKAIFGNIGAVDFWVDGHLIKRLGTMDERKEISLLPDALKSYGFAE